MSERVGEDWENLGHVVETTPVSTPSVYEKHRPPESSVLETRTLPLTAHK